MQIRSGMKVRIADMNGCMAHRRENIHEGVVLEVVKKKVYGDTQKRPWAMIQLDNLDIIEKCAEPHLWIEYEGVLECRD